MARVSQERNAERRIVEFAKMLAACAEVTHRHGKRFLVGTTTSRVGYIPNLVGRVEETALRMYNDWAA